MKSLFFNGKPGKHHLNDSHWDVNVRSEVQDGVNGLWTEKEMTVEAVIEEEQLRSQGWAKKLLYLLWLVKNVVNVHRLKWKLVS